MPSRREDLPGTLQRSSAKARRTYQKALDSAHEQYEGDEERAHRVAFSALKHSFEKQGDRWVEKAERGPSDPQAAKSGVAARRSRTPTAGGHRVGTTKREVLEEARRLDVPGRSRMSRDELVEAVAAVRRRGR